MQHALAALTEIAAAEQILIVNGTPLDARQPLSAYRLPVAPARSQQPRSCSCLQLRLEYPQAVPFPSPSSASACLGCALDQDSLAPARPNPTLPYPCHCLARTDPG